MNLPGNWISNKALQAKTIIRIQAENADLDLESVMSKRISEDGTAKLKSSKIYADSDQTKQLFNIDGNLNPALKIQVRNINLDRLSGHATSDCPVWIDSLLCESGKRCSFHVIRLMFQTSSGEIVNPFTSGSSTNIITVNSVSKTEDDCYRIFDDVKNVELVDLTEWKKYAIVFARKLAESFSFLADTEFTISVNDNDQSIAPVVSYFYVFSDYSVTLNKPAVFYSVNSEFNAVCLHLAGVSGACSGEKVDNTLPRSNFFYSTETGDFPILKNNCNPFDCCPEYENNYSVKIPVCIKYCPFGAIKSKDSGTVNLPTDNNEQLKTLYSLKMTQKPFA